MLWKVIIIYIFNQINREEQRKKWELREKEIELEIQKKKELEKESQNQKDEFNNNLLEENKEINKNTKEMKSIEVHKLIKNIKIIHKFGNNKFMFFYIGNGKIEIWRNQPRNRKT